MELTEQDIEQIEGYLHNTLRGDELAMFQVRIEQDREFAEAVLLHRDVTRGVTAYGKANMKRELAAAGAAVMAAGELADYNPSTSNLRAVKPKKHSGSSWGTVLTIVGTAGLAAAAYVWQAGTFGLDSINQNFEQTQDHPPTLQGDAPTIDNPILQGVPVKTRRDTHYFRESELPDSLRGRPGLQMIQAKDTLSGARPQ